MNIKSAVYVLFFCSTFLFSQENIEVLAELPRTISETSGLIFYNGKLITHNDSGNSPQLFEIDTTSYQITRTVTITNVENIDWEDLAQDEQYIYIGDFGNNSGTRKDLSIYRISKQEYAQSDAVTAEQISFSYEDQTDFTNDGNSDWDAEAFFVLDDQLIVLTKQWQSKGTVAYALTKNIEDQVARKIDAYQINGLVTGASYNPENKVLFIVGYSSTLAPFAVQINNSTATSIFNDSLVRTNLNIGLAQVESITYAGTDRYFFTSEYFARSNPAITLESQLFKFDIKNNNENPNPNPGPDSTNTKVTIFQRSGYELIEYNLNSEELLLGRAIYDTSGRQVHYLLGSEIEKNSIDLSTLQNAIYYLTFYFDTRIVSIPFAKK